MQLELFDTTYREPVRLEELFAAYYDCRRHKRKTFNALEFEADFEQKLVNLWRAVNEKTYYPGRSIAFIVNKPVKREIFAADFQDRVIHHLVINKLMPLFEALFIRDSYSCRAGKGTLYGIRRVEEFIRACSENYSKDCYILKMDIQSFFMSIDKNILYSRLERFIREYYHGVDKETILRLVKIIVYHCPQHNCLIKGRQADWEGLPRSKSLFWADDFHGLPIGNLSSQIFANFYMDAFDKFVKNELKAQYYGRYVDDFVIVHRDKQFLVDIQEKLRRFMVEKLSLRLHPRKVYLQHYSKGVKFIGAVIKPGRVYIGNRTKGNLYQKMREFNRLSESNKSYSEQAEHFVSSINSYLGFMVHYSTYKIRHKMIWENISPRWWPLIYTYSNAQKIVLKKDWTPRVKYLKQMRRKTPVEEGGEVF